MKRSSLLRGAGFGLLLLLPETALSAPVAPARAAEWFKEAALLCQSPEAQLWPVSLCSPLLLVDPATREVVASQADAEGHLRGKDGIFTGTLPPHLNVANTALTWAGVEWTMLVLPLPEEPRARAILFAHEMWHRLQDEIGFPSSGAANAHLDTLEGRVWLQLEWRALRAALAAGDESRRQHVQDALLFRATRRSLFPAAAEEERAMEMHEGLAEYTGVKAGAGSEAAREAQDRLSAATQRETFVRSFAYASGAAYGLLLDDAVPAWRERLRPEDDLGLLLEKALGLARPGTKAAVALRASKYEGDQLRESETGREKARQSRLAALRAQFIEGPVLILPLRRMNMQFDPGLPVPLDTFGTVYPGLRLVDEWGILTVTDGGAFLASDFSEARVGAAGLGAGATVTGKGWTLQLADGWMLREGARAGDFRVAARRP